jgi:hypothetical protein
MFRYKKGFLKISVFLYEKTLAYQNKTNKEFYIIFALQALLKNRHSYVTVYRRGVIKVIFSLTANHVIPEDHDFIFYLRIPTLCSGRQFKGTVRRNVRGIENRLKRFILTNYVNASRLLNLSETPSRERHKTIKPVSASEQQFNSIFRSK